MENNHQKKKKNQITSIEQISFLSIFIVYTFDLFTFDNISCYTIMNLTKQTI